MNIVKSITKPKGLRVVIYGVAGVGKTTLAAKLPDALFLDFEDGTHGLAVDKLSASDLPESYDAMKGLVAELFQFTLVVRRATLILFPDVAG